MAGGKNAFLERQRIANQTYFDAGLQMGRQQILDMMSIVLNDPDINALIRSFVHSLTYEEKKEVKNELDTKSAKEVTAELLNDDEDEVEESKNSEGR